MRSIVRTLIALLALLAIVGGLGAFWFVTRGDEFLRQTVLAELRKLSPDLDFELGLAQFDFRGRIRLADLTIKVRRNQRLLATLTETIVTADRQQLIDHQNVVVQHVRFVNPDIQIEQRDGVWIVPEIQFRSAGGLVPQIEISHGVLHIRTGHAEQELQERLTIEVNTATLTPQKDGVIDWKAALGLGPTGPLALSGAIDPQSGLQSLDVEWRRIPVDDSLIALVQELAPATQPLVARVNSLLDEERGRQQAIAHWRNFRTPGEETDLIIPVASRTVSALPWGLSFTTDLHLRWRADEGTAPMWQCRLDIAEGRLANALTPWPITNLKAALYFDPTQAICQEFRCSLGDATLWFKKAEWQQTGEIKVQANLGNLRLTDDLKNRLPFGLLKGIEEIGLDGLFQLEGTAEKLPQSPWKYRVAATVSEGVVTPQKFPYTVRQVTGTAVLLGPDETRATPTSTINVTGMAGSTPVVVTGWAHNPGPESEVYFDIRSENLPTEPAILEACPEVLRATLHDLQVEGRGHVWMRLYRPSGLGQKFAPKLAVQVFEAAMQPRWFPYRLDHLSGQIDWEGDLVTFQEIVAQHDGARITGKGSYQKGRSPQELELTLSAADAVFDRQLLKALPAKSQEVWRYLDLQGRFDLQDTTIRWSQGQETEVRLPKITLRDAGMTIQSFPYALRNIQGEVAYDRGQLVISRFSAKHEQTSLRGSGTGWFLAGEPWSLTFDKLNVDDLNPSPPFRRTLPEPLRVVLDQLNPTGTFSIEGQGRIASTDVDSQTLTAEWDSRLSLHRCGLTAGQRAEEISGTIDFKGTFDGTNSNFTGKLDLDSVTVLGHQIAEVRGPFAYQNGRFTAGSVENIPRQQPGAQPLAPQGERITGKAVDGVVTLDAEVDPANGPTYRAFLSLNRGSLERYAQRYLRGYSDVAGIMNGWMLVYGQGPREDQVRGQGSLMIYPAALFNLPIFVQIFSAMRFQPPDRAAFDYANHVFTISDSRFNFESIDLVGKSISFRGRGYIRFDGAMSLDFYSQMGGRTPLPLVNQLIGIATSDWVRVLVRGNINAPVAHQEALPEISDAFRNFLLAPFAPRPAAGPIPTYRGATSPGPARQ